MAKSSYNDLVVEETLRRRRLITVELQKRFKGTKPFRQVPLTDDEVIQEESLLTNETLQQRIDEDGVKPVNAFLRRADKIRRANGLG